MTNTQNDVRDWLRLDRNTILNVVPIMRSHNKKYEIKYRHNIYMIHKDIDKVENISANAPLVLFETYKDCMEDAISTYCKHISKKSSKE